MASPDTPIHDAIVIDQLDLHATLTCRACDGDAHWRVITRCCRTMLVVLCHPHFERTRRTATRFLADSRHPRCVTCSTPITVGASFDDVYRTVRL